MTAIDWIIVAFTVLMALWGYSQGIVVGALSLAGMLLTVPAIVAVSVSAARLDAARPHKSDSAMAAAGAADYIRESDVPKIKHIFWGLNVTAFSPSLAARTGARAAIRIAATAAGTLRRSLPA